MTITQTMTYKKSTKGTHVFENQDDAVAVSSLYISRAALPIPVPQSITLTIEVS